MRGKQKERDGGRERRCVRYRARQRGAEKKLQTEEEETERGSWSLLFSLCVRFSGERWVRGGGPFGKKRCWAGRGEEDSRGKGRGGKEKGMRGEE